MDWPRMVFGAPFRLEPGTTDLFYCRPDLPRSSFLIYSGYAFFILSRFFFFCIF